MGNSKSKKSARGRSSPRSKSGFQAIPDKYQTLQEVQDALRAAGLESSNLIIGVDYTKSNTWNGKRTFGGNNLHAIFPNAMNPYQEVIDIVGRTLEPFDDDKLIPVLGFGDATTTDKSVFPFFPDRPCNGFQEALVRYAEITPNVKLSGPTSFAPLIREAIKIVQQDGGYHILVIIADGQVNNVQDTTQAIVEATKYPISIICIGVGDGPWDLMEKFDDELPKRRFDNFQFVDYHGTMLRAENREVTFSVNALQEIPDQFLEIQRLQLM
mmetsp:Transcript_9087/g.10096  ORF Transcript_9087/g.10096 Transcript_9087/m.10096 type:complete len:269 (+) Transcript_9087:230-1036(+)|eukprot:CAMPEP_0168519146 /NCGR_PEP_ID=MMETSP0405-20121227/7144_1 /TAXON_ID=498012 /ORGANISM="Trichosphaerium sp, Strain Am-I-7 wt" /LENGTH=268 /DNA_ID=CAMNT_0008539633 /DNA_START=157 /DNA_END=966 /DNA_ORIENTATION=-